MLTHLIAVGVNLARSHPEISAGIPNRIVG